MNATIRLQSGCNTASHHIYALLLPLFLLMALGATLPVAATASEVDVYPGENIAQQRIMYRNATKALAEKRDQQFHSLRQQLDNYPLAAYLDYRYLIRDSKNLSGKRIEHFEQQHHHARLARRLKQRWLSKLARTEQWQALVDHYDANLANDNLRCHHALALFRTGAENEALAKARQLWLSGSSRPDSCDPIFHIFSERKLITPDLAWQRFLLAYDARNIRLANYLKRFLDQDDLAVADLLTLLYHDPSAIDQRWQFLPHSAELHPVKRQLLKRYSRKNPKDAAEFLYSKTATQESSISEHKELLEKQRQELASYILTRQALIDYRQLPALYEQLQQPTDIDSLTWLLRAHLAAGNWQAVQETLERLPASDAEHERWQYWYYRSRELLGTLTDTEKSDYRQLAMKRSFYGFYTAENLGEPYAFTALSRDEGPNALDTTNTAIQRGIEHYLHGEITQARQEWNSAIRNFNAEQKFQAALLAHDLGWHNQAIQLAIAAGEWHHLWLRFPDVYRDFYQFNALRHNYSSAWLYAIGRQESAFASDAKSSAGAVGLMQLLPSTAKQVANQAGLEYSRARLFDETYNIQIASDYLGQLYRKFSFNRALASAAYNAGPHRVERWLKMLDNTLPLDAWIESIPFSETRQYAQNVLSFSLIYQVMHENDSEANRDIFVDEHEKTISPRTAQPKKQNAQ